MIAHLARHQDEAALVAEAKSSLAAGRCVTEAAVDAWIDSLGTDSELPPPSSVPALVKVSDKRR